MCNRYQLIWAVIIIPVLGGNKLQHLNLPRVIFPCTDKYKYASRGKNTSVSADDYMPKGLEMWCRTRAQQLLCSNSNYLGFIREFGQI